LHSGHCILFDCYLQNRDRIFRKSYLNPATPIELIEEIKTTIQRTNLQRLEITRTVGTIVSNYLDIEPEQVDITANLANDLGIDSLSWQELLITLEETFTIIISDDIAGTLTTVQQLIDYVILIVQKENRLSPQLQS
jgi:acyl carrier protein